MNQHDVEHIKNVAINAVNHSMNNPMLTLEDIAAVIEKCRYEEFGNDMETGWNTGLTLAASIVRLGGSNVVDH